MNNLIIRAAALLIHILVNVILITWLMQSDLTGSWLIFAGFLLLLLVLFYLLVIHLISFLQFIKTKTR